MKLLTALLFCTLISLTSKTNEMIETLKTHIKNKASEKAISFIKQNSEVLNLEDENGSSGLMIIAYSGLDKVFEQAIELKKTFSFHEAIVCGKKDLVEDYLVKSNSNLINTYSNDGFTPLSLAAFFNQTEIAKSLIKLGANPNLSAKNPSKVNALHAAIAKENYELCKLLIENGANVDAVQMQNVTALHSAVHRGNLDLIKLLIENNASIDSKMDNGDTALIIAKREGHENIEAYLLDKQN
ncbi:ankyrin repeat domain-containing protein [Flavivirga abyssicola]|uniref:ankyrin repeat domain-containing protein n=1 Tax=Flavivirga abyssicola TaxID=3063533 RepID=UPI0026E07E38|nr:ankyrin repeat domain-containing protein [Flavivirga sp. MEBiC07777]WVK14253.1 ankyrin repeat domain-containing protein [Flavivirga sp. MEBiC07777]